jgi:hypothetical protein
MTGLYLHRGYKLEESLHWRVHSAAINAWSSRTQISMLPPIPDDVCGADDKRLAELPPSKLTGQPLNTKCAAIKTVADSRRPVEKGSEASVSGCLCMPSVIAAPSSFHSTHISRFQCTGLLCPSASVVSSRRMLMAAFSSRFCCYRLLSGRFTHERALQSTLCLPSSCSLNTASVRPSLQ